MEFCHCTGLVTPSTLCLLSTTKNSRQSNHLPPERGRLSSQAEVSTAVFFSSCFKTSREKVLIKIHFKCIMMAQPSCRQPCTRVCGEDIGNMRVPSEVHSFTSKNPRVHCMDCNAPGILSHSDQKWTPWN